MPLLRPLAALPLLAPQLEDVAAIFVDSGARTQVPATQKCSRCAFHGPLGVFPRGTNMAYLKTCARCHGLQAEQRAKKISGAAEKENEPPGQQLKRSLKAAFVQKPPRLSWGDFVTLLTENHDKPFELTAFVTLSAQLAVDGPQTGSEKAKFVSGKLSKL